MEPSVVVKFDSGEEDVLARIPIPTGFIFPQLATEQSPPGGQESSLGDALLLINSGGKIFITLQSWYFGDA